MTQAIIDQATFNTLRDMMGADFMPELIDTYFSDSASLLAELQTALAAGDPHSFGRAAHSLKGNSATFGATNLAAGARELEMMGKNGSLEGAKPKLDALLAEYQQVQAALEGLRDAL